MRKKSLEYFPSIFNEITKTNEAANPLLDSVWQYIRMLFYATLSNLHIWHEIATNISCTTYLGTIKWSFVRELIKSLNLNSWHLIPSLLFFSRLVLDIFLFPEHKMRKNGKKITFWYFHTPWFNNFLFEILLMNFW
jgi:hypothetical protein